MVDWSLSVISGGSGLGFGVGAGCSGLISVCFVNSFRSASGSLVSTTPVRLGGHRSGSTSYSATECSQSPAVRESKVSSKYFANSPLMISNMPVSTWMIRWRSRSRYLLKSLFKAEEYGVPGGDAVLERVVAGVLGPPFFPFWRFALICLSVAVVLYRSLA